MAGVLAMLSGAVLLAVSLALAAFLFYLGPDRRANRVFAFPLMSKGIDEPASRVQETATTPATVALALLLAAALAGCIGAEEAPPETASTPDADPAAPADASTSTRWKAEDCTGISLVWTPPIEDLDPVVGPWTPAEGPVPDRGVFVLFGVECPGSTVDGDATGPLRTGAAIVPVEEPSAGPNVSSPDGWSAVPGVVAPEGPVHDLFEGHAFPTTPGDVAVEVDRDGDGGTASLAYDTPDGTVQARASFGGSPQEREVHGALVTPSRDPVGVFAGPEEMTRYTGQGVVASEGETWVSELDLPPTPFAVAVDTDFSWDFAFRLSPSAGG